MLSLLGSLDSWGTGLQWIIAASTAVVVGASVALIFVNNKISSRQTEQITKVERATADANERAADANKLAQEARAKQIDLEQQNIVLNTSLAKMQMEAANAQRTLLEVRDRIKARHLTEEQKAKFMSLLKDAPIARVRVSYAEQDGEARAFADQIVTALEQLHWTVSGHEPIPENRGVAHKTEDLVFDVPTDGPLPVCLQPLQNALAEIGFSSGTRDRGSPDGVIDLFVGPKRPRD